MLFVLTMAPSIEIVKITFFIYLQIKALIVKRLIGKYDFDCFLNI